jgi:hypothetical protein
MIQPATQGDYDGLCGLYCIINAVRLVLTPHRDLSREEVKALFAEGVRFLARKGDLPKAVHSCVGERVWPRLAERIVASAQPIADRPILLERPRWAREVSVRETLLRIEKMIVAGKAPCVFLRGNYRHYSVISGYTSVSLKLFDSFGYRWVRRRSCGTTGTPARLHRLHVQSLIALTAP